MIKFRKNTLTIDSNHLALPVIRALVAVIGATVMAATVRAAPELEDVLVTGTYAPQQALTSSVSVLDAQQIALLNKTSVADLLKTLPGLLVEEQGGPGGLTAVSIRGGESNFTLVLIDGVPVNDPTNFRGGSFDFANLDPGMVDRIEVVRGAQSAIYGSDAVAGVINIITRRAVTGHQQSATAQWGEHDYYTLGASALGTVDDFNYAVQLASRDDGEPLPGSTRDNDSANIRLGWQPSAQQSLAVGYRYIKGDRSSYPEQSGGPAYALFDALDNSDYKQDTVSFEWRMQLSPDWQSALTANHFEQQENYNSPGIPPYFDVPPNGSDTDFTRDQVRWVHTLQLAPDYVANAGVDLRREDGHSTGYVEFFGDRTPTDFELDRDTRGAFVQLSATPLSALLLQASARYDNPQDFDSETSLQTGARYAFEHGFSVAANWGQSYKLPSFFALGHALVGNPELQPEQGESWDAGVTWESGEAIRLAATWFHNDFRDLVDFDDETFRNVNRNHVQTSGVELQADWQLRPDLKLRSQATYTDIDVQNEESVLTGRPQWVASAVLQWQISPQWDTALDYMYGGRQWAASRHTGELVTEKLDDYHRVDWVLHWQLAPRWQLQFALDNVLDENYDTAVGFAAAEREARIGVLFSTL